MLFQETTKLSFKDGCRAEDDVIAKVDGMCTVCMYHYHTTPSAWATHASLYIKQGMVQSLVDRRTYVVAVESTCGVLPILLVSVYLSSSQEHLKAITLKQLDGVLKR